MDQLDRKPPEFKDSNILPLCSDVYVHVTTFLFFFYHFIFSQVTMSIIGYRHIDWLMILNKN